MKITFPRCVKAVKKYTGSKESVRNARLVELAIQKLAEEDGWVDIKVISNRGIQLVTGMRSGVVRSNSPYSTNTLIKLIATALEQSK